MKTTAVLILLVVSLASHAQVDTSFVYNTSKPYGTLDIRIAKSATRYYYLQENKTISFREVSGVRTNTYRDMTSWDSSPYTEGNLRERAGTTDNFIMNYRLLFPVGYQPNFADGYPLIVMMHGAGERANCWDTDCYWADHSWKPSSNTPPAPTTSGHQLLNNDHNLSHGGSQHLAARNLAGARLPNDPSVPPRAFPGFVLFGQNLNGWTTGEAQDMIKLVRLVAKKYNVDPNRIYVHGLSNGGIATYNLIKRAPWLFAAALPMSAPSESGIISQNLLPEVAHIPIWTFQGGRDIDPRPSRTESYVRAFREAGADVRYSLYENLGHGTWNNAYSEPDFFSWMRSKSKTQIHVFYGNTTICGTTGEGVRLGLANGFLAYQWEKDGIILSGATGHEHVATEPGVYRARFSRESRTPTAGQWEKWSDPVTVTGSSSVQPQIIPLTTTHLRGPDNAGPNTISLKSTLKADRYLWYRNGVLIDIPLNNMDDTVSVFTITSTSTTNNGAYTLRTSGFDGCASPPSDPINLFFNNSAPINDGNPPQSFSVVSKTSSTATLAWNDASSMENAYEIWRRAPGQAFVLAGRTNANAESFIDRGLIPSTAYDYKIRAVNNSGRSGYAPSDALATNLVVTTSNDTQAPSTPRNLRVVRNTTSSISLAWDASSDNDGAIKHYVVYFGSQSRNTGSPATSFTLTGLPINTSYNITVKAVDLGGLSSAASNQITGTTAVSGLWYGHSTGAWTDLDQITIWNQPEFTGWVPNITLEPRTQEEYFNFEFTGYLFIEQGGSYNFFLNSDDGSRLYIDGNQVVDFDGLHGRSGENDGFGRMSPSPVSLTAGPHEIRVIFFEYTSGQSLDVAYQGADTDNEKMLIPDEALKSGEASPPTNSLPVVNITSPANDQQFTSPASISITATASDADGSVTKVEFYNGENKLGEDLTSPYAFTWNGVSAGNYPITVTAIDNEGSSASATVAVFVTTGSSCAGTGSIQAEMWAGIPGNDVGAIPVNAAPTSITDLTLFETPTNIGDNYGSRVRGYLCVPTSGSYTFWIATDDTGELWLSTDENPANKRRIAYVAGWARPREWERYPSQKSVAINLVAGQRYYIEALLKEGSGGDNLAVGWQLPDGTLQRPIAGNHLAPFGGSGSGSPIVNITSPEDGASFAAPAAIEITAAASIDEGSITKVEFYNGTVKLGEDLTAPYTYSWTNVSAGSYSIIAKAIDNDGGSTSSTVDISVISEGACAGTGTLQIETWTGVSGLKVSDIPVDSPPSFVGEINLFETPRNIADSYGSRVRGYLCVPTSGDYLFWIATDDMGELWLSTDENPANKKRIAYVAGWTNPREWDKYPSQQSVPINLVAGRRYYVEALLKEASGGDHLAVGWQLPGGTLERPIGGNHLVPFSNSGTELPIVDITSPSDGQSFIAPASVNIAVTATDNDGSVTKVEFFNGNNKLGEDLTAPYAFAWNSVPVGNYVITATATDNEGLSASASVDISVMDGSACTATGTMQMEVWTGVSGWNVSSIPVNSPPNSVMDIHSFETVANIGDNYGSRVRGYLCVPQTGSYTFWISSDDKSELWLSTNDNPANKARIAYVDGWTYPAQWDRYATQKSAPINLVAGQRYYVEALLKEGTGADHLAVGWQLPDGSLERPIPATRISGYETQTTMSTFAMTEMLVESDAMMTEDVTQFSEEEALQVFPNPAISGGGELTISGHQKMSGPRETIVEVLRMTGELMYSEKVLCEAGCDGYSVSVKKEIPPGVYLVNVLSNGKRHTKRLLVK